MYPIIKERIVRDTITNRVGIAKIGELIIYDYYDSSNGDSGIWGLQIARLRADLGILVCAKYIESHSQYQREYFRMYAVGRIYMIKWPWLYVADNGTLMTRQLIHNGALLDQMTQGAYNGL